MNNNFAIIGPLIGIAGVITGVLLNEFMRRRNRRELYAPKIFEKRLMAYEGLLEKIRQGGAIVDEVIESKELNQEQRQELVSVVIHDMAEFVDKNQLYLDEEIIVHCVSLFMGAEEIYYANEKEKINFLSKYHRNRREALRMVSEDSGISEINKLFKKVNKPRIDGSAIHYYRKKKREAMKNRCK